jgi:hypothetical protein
VKPTRIEVVAGAVVHEGIAHSYFPPRAAAGSASQLQVSSDAGQHIPLSADAPSV